MAPTLVSEAPTSTLNGVSGLGCFKMGAVEKAVFNWMKALSAAGFQRNDRILFVSVVAIVLKLQIKHW